MSEYCKNTQNAINFIEDNLYNDIVLEEVANVSKFSLYHFYRVFSTLTGLTIKQYIRLRRLSMAAIEMRDTNNSIIDIAVKYGFNSQEAFSRAFSDMFSIMPGKYRKTKQPLPLLLKVDLIKPLTHVTTNDMHYDECKDLRIYYIQKPHRKIIAKVNPSPQKIHEFYNMCERTGAFGRLTSIKEGIFGPFGCVITAPVFSHLIGIEVEYDYCSEIPKDLDIININSSRYVVFHHYKYRSEMHDKVIKSVWNTSKSWNPLNHGFEWNYEKAPIYEVDDDELGFFVYKPIKPKETDEETKYYKLT
ncbi:helix-turn-helix domain-containing protein [Alkaliphilus peptidifermentans]|uniref:AraC-type DNA-binding protein n=1 Tax=Alkaliphilus peptidifermentans DSM 18978 TaxID=1120976 RepID=A0A1G5HDI8_9FIRM|nr:helix-turn-helix domain-containing protein [Alkaliphilus peptidifermentans]SCY61400.1 AraC-type DNA-binding protein [Alkaliphilus peptidifermentans DSM 18978]